MIKAKPIIINRTMPLVTLALSLILTLCTQTVLAQEEKRPFDIGASSVAEALKTFAIETDSEILFTADIVQGQTTQGVQGQYTDLEALEMILANTGLNISQSDDDVYMVRAGDDQETSASAGLDTQGGAEKKPEMARRIDEMVVTATKREQNIRDVPISILAMTGESLDESGVTDLQSLSLAVPGLLVEETGSHSRRISIRGIGNVFGTSSLVGLYVDESSVVALPARQVDLRIYDLERIEVLKGPQGTLYGEGSVGGTIRYITKDPELGSFGGELILDGAVTKSGGASQEIKGVLNIPLIDDTLGLRIAAQYDKSGGWIDQPALLKEDINDYELFNVRTKLLWVPSDNLEVEAAAIIHRNDLGAQNIGENEDGNYSQAFGDLSTPAAQDDYDLFSLTANYDLGSANLVIATSYLDVDKELTNYGGQCCFVTTTGAPGELSNVLDRLNIPSAEILTQEIRLASNSSGSWQWTSGAFYRDAQVVRLNISGLNFGEPGITPVEFAGPVYREYESKSWAVFGETGYSITDHVELGVGLRYFEDDRKHRTVESGSFTQSATFDSLNPKVYLKYAVNDGINIFANVAKGFRSGGFNGDGQPTFDPETVLSYELGSKMLLLEGRLSAEAALFYSQYKDYQILGFTPPDPIPLYITSNAGDAEIQGIEWTFSWLAHEQLELGFSGNYMDTEFTEINATLTSHIEGDPLDLVPKYGVGLWANYSFDWSNNSPGFFRIDYNQQGKSNYRNRSFDDPANGLVYFSQSDVIDMLNARLGWQRGDWSTELYGLNLLDEDGYVGAISIELFSSRPRPRTFGINLEYQF